MATIAPEVASLAAIYAEHVRILGDSEPTRRFLAASLVMSRFHMASRPVSKANVQFSDRLGASCAALLHVLLELTTARLEPEVEEGFAALQRSMERADLDIVELRRIYRVLYRVHFLALNQPWSRHRPVMSPPAPLVRPDTQNVLIAVGPNIGIGDELLFFELARRVRRRAPRATITTISYNRTLWDLCEEVDARLVETRDQLAPFVAASSLLRRDPEAAVVLVEFASAPIYRMLEAVAPLFRFAYLDTGARLARVVDQSHRWVSERVLEPKEGGIYETLGRMLEFVGLPSAPAGRVEPLRVVAHTPKVYLNPFSSKPFHQLTPEWWAESVALGAAGREVCVEVFSGVGAECWSYANRLLAALDAHPNVRATMHGEPAHVPSIAESLAHCLEADLILGLDTFTAHIGVLGGPPCVTVYFGSEWDAWRVRHSHVLHVHINSPPAAAAAAVTAFCWPPNDPRVTALAADVLTRTRGLQRGSAETPAALLESYRALRDSAREVLSAAPEVHPALCDVPRRNVEELEMALRSSLEGPPDESGALLIGNALRVWTESNAFRFIRAIAGETA